MVDRLAMDNRRVVLIAIVSLTVGFIIGHVNATPPLVYDTNRIVIETVATTRRQLLDDLLLTGIITKQQHNTLNSMLSDTLADTVGERSPL